MNINTATKGMLLVVAGIAALGAGAADSWLGKGLFLGMFCLTAFAWFSSGSKRVSPVAALLIQSISWLTISLAVWIDGEGYWAVPSALMAASTGWEYAKTRGQRDSGEGSAQDSEKGGDEEGLK